MVVAEHEKGRILIVNLKMIPTLAVKYIIRISFFLFSLFFPVNQKKVTFASYRSEKLEGNLLYIYKEFERRNEDYQYQFLFKKFNSSFIGKIEYFLHMLKASFALATSRFFIIDDFYFPVYVIKPRKDTDIVQLWHAAGAFKKFGLSTINRSFGPSEDYLKHIKIHSNYTKVYVSSKNIIPFYAEAFDMKSSKIIPLGVPRTDYFFEFQKHIDVKKTLIGEFPKIGDRKIILYAPTFRGKSHYQDSFSVPIDIPLMKEYLGNEYVLLIHLHPYMRKDINIEEENQNFVFHIKEKFNVEQLLAVSDILLTDYSSVIFDFSLLVRPIAFIADDLGDYIKERDFYYDFTSIIPGPFFTQTLELINWITQKEFDLVKIEKFRDYFFDFNDGKSSQRIVDNLIKNER